MTKEVDILRIALEGISTCKRCELCARSATDGLKEANGVRDEHEGTFEAPLSSLL